MGYSIRTARYRYTEWLEGKAGRELYDQSRDTDEVHNLADLPVHQEIVAQLSRLLKSYVQLKLDKRTARN